jgi:hypothetical protein
MNGSHQIAYNVGRIGEEAEFNARLLNNFLMLIREMKFRFSTSAAFLPIRLLAVVLGKC